MGTGTVTRGSEVTLGAADVEMGGYALVRVVDGVVVALRVRRPDADAVLAAALGPQAPVDEEPMDIENDQGDVRTRAVREDGRPLQDL